MVSTAFSGAAKYFKIFYLFVLKRCLRIGSNSKDSTPVKKLHPFSQQFIERVLSLTVVRFLKPLNHQLIM